MYRMISTKALREFNSQNPPTITLGRKDDVQKKYDKFCKDSENGKRFISRVTDILEESEYYFVENDYPYYVEPNITHMICWYKKGKPCEILKNICEKSCVITYWENLPYNKSIPDINHIHVFISKLK